MASLALIGVLESQNGKEASYARVWSRHTGNYAAIS
jgi:hypothetical protein